MAEKRMFAKHIIDSDMFLDLSATAQNLYFHLAMRADDDGFINSVKKIMRVVGAQQNDIELLIYKSFIIPLESGVCVVKHWRIHNYLRSDRYKETLYKKEKELIELDIDNTYMLKKGDSGIPVGIPTVYQRSTNGLPAVDKRLTQYSIDKYSLDQYSLDKYSLDKKKEKKEKKIDNVLQMINDLEVSHSLKNAYLDYYNYRQEIKKKLTVLAFERILKKYEKWGYDNELIIKSIENSIDNSWTGLFEIQKSQAKKQEKTATGNIFLDMLEQKKDDNIIKKDFFEMEE